MDEIVKKVAGLGLPGIILVIVMATTGLTGAAAITAALALLGGPAGMLGGIAVLGLTGLITEGLAQIGLENFLTAIYCDRRQREPQGKLLEEVESLMLLDGDIKDRLRATIRDGCGCAEGVDLPLGVDSQEAIARLKTVQGMTPAHPRDYKSATPVARLRDGSVLKTWKNLAGVDHVFLADQSDRVIFGGYVGWLDSEALFRTIEQIKRDLT